MSTSLRAARGRLARALRAHTQQNIAQGVREVHYGIVRQVSPLQVEIEGRSLVLDENDLVVTQWVRRYGYDYGLSVGDTVLVSHMPNDDFVVHDVVSTDRIEQGLDQSSAVTVSLTSRNGHIVRKAPYLANDGTLIGYTPVYTDLSSDGAPT